jgi:hypothetical protein
VAAPTHSVDNEAWLTTIAQDLRKRLSKSATIRTRSAPAEETNTGGWSTELGYSRAAKTTKAEVWFDRYLGLDRPRTVWAGFRWSTRAAFDKACGLWANRVRADRRITDQDASVRRRIYTLKRPRMTRRPYLERYAPEFFFGIFWLRPTTGAAKARWLADAARFFNAALTTDGRIDLAYVERRVLRRDELAALEDRHRAAETACFRRNRTLLDERKRRDRYTCRVCGFRFDQFYAGLTFAYAEAHHIIPLHKRKRRRPTTLSDLRTVCANCHRMLHYRLFGTRSDLKTLGKMVTKARRALR